MFDQANESSFRLDVAGLSDPFEVLAFTGSEALSEPFSFEIDVLIDDPHSGLDHVLGHCGFAFGDLLSRRHRTSVLPGKPGGARRLH